MSEDRKPRGLAPGITLGKYAVSVSILSNQTFSDVLIALTKMGMKLDVITDETDDVIILAKLGDETDYQYTVEMYRDPNERINGLDEVVDYISCMTIFPVENYSALGDRVACLEAANAWNLVNPHRLAFDEDEAFFVYDVTVDVNHVQDELATQKLSDWMMLSPVIHRYLLNPEAGVPRDVS